MPLRREFTPNLKCRNFAKHSVAFQFGTFWLERLWRTSADDLGRRATLHGSWRNWILRVWCLKFEVYLPFFLIYLQFIEWLIYSEVTSRNHQAYSILNGKWKLDRELNLVMSGAVEPKAFPPANGPPERDAIAVYKIYSEKRPDAMNKPDAPYYLEINSIKSP